MRGVVLDDLRNLVGTGDPGLDRRLRLAVERAGNDAPEHAAEDLRDLHGELVTRLGGDHPDTLAVRIHMALCLSGRTEAARSELPAILPDLELVLGPGHEDVVEACRLLAAAHVMTGEPAAAPRSVRRRSV